MAELSLERRRDQPFFAVAVDLDGAEAAALGKWLGVKSGIEGPLDLRIEASSVGRTPFDMVAGLAGEVEIKVGPGELRGLGIPELKRTFARKTGDDPPPDRSLALPFSAIDVEAALARGILEVEGGQLALDPMSDDAAELVVDGTVDLLLWIADLTLRSKAETEVDDPISMFRVVGPPDRPDGYRLSGN